MACAFFIYPFVAKTITSSASDASTRIPYLSRYLDLPSVSHSHEPKCSRRLITGRWRVDGINSQAVVSSTCKDKARYGSPAVLTDCSPAEYRHTS